MRKKRLTVNGLLKHGWIKAKMKSGETEYLYTNDGNGFNRYTLTEAMQITRNAYPDEYTL